MPKDAPMKSITYRYIQAINMQLWWKLSLIHSSRATLSAQLSKIHHYRNTLKTFTTLALWSLFRVECSNFNGARRRFNTV